MTTISHPTGNNLSRLSSAATTNATSVKASAGNLFSIIATNTAAYDVFLKLYDKASAPTVGTDTPVATINIKTVSTFQFSKENGLRFANGIAFAITKLAADSDTTALAAGDLLLSYEWA